MIEVRGLTKEYGKVRAVDDLTFNVSPGIVTGFLGPNGAGKSTTMRMILGLDTPTSGTATIGGVEYRKLKKPLTHVGALLDAKAVHPNRSARNHLLWLAQSNGIPASRVDEALALVGLSSVAKKKAGGFSLGMGQRLGLAAALLGDPEVIILDEPVNGLDPEGIRWVRDFLRRLAAEGRTILVSSHLLAEMAQTADHLVVIGRGKLVASCSTAEFIQAHSRNTTVVKPATPQLAAALNAEGLQVTENNGALEVNASPERVGKLAFEAGVALQLLTQQQASLEDAFMEMTSEVVQYGSKN